MNVQRYKYHLDNQTIKTQKMSNKWELISY
ncbi:hypothetical protein BC781_101180 [Sediminitomix flava]|uniref:Uncharacterized protein n=1 Tax=Sediminitomix flava TaxID=379075 RepID=A0A315ZGG6_SEDFL|nr:hypothetical protein BC781_101180 [Sediminitomix flava]